MRSFTVADRPAGYVAAYLSAEHGIGVRDGRFCAHPLLAAALRAERGGAAGEHRARHHRASTSTGSSTRLATLVTRGASWTYAPVGGRWTPTPDTRSLDPLGLGAGRAGAGPVCGR